MCGNVLTKFIARVQQFFGLIVLGFAAITLAGCGGGGADSSSTATSNGTLAVALTDAPGDFISYTVDVLSIKLTHADGRQVETLPNKTRVDFAQYTDLSEFLSLVSIPQGRYVEASLVLDYSNANILVENADGSALPVTTILDTNNQPLTTFEVKLQLSGDRIVPIVPGITRFVSLDFNLAKSNKVTLGSSSATINVSPVLDVVVDRELPKWHRLRGPLQTVDVANGTYSIFIRPFLNLISNNSKMFGTASVTTTNSTIYEIDGISYQGNDGLVVLASKSKFTAVVTFGKIKFNPFRIEADQVYAGSSVPGGTLDVVQGSVVARSGNMLTINGVTLIRADGSISVNDNTKVELFDSTTVTKALALGTFNINDISVGQRLMVFGVMTTDSQGNAILSAANGYARMEISGVRGNVTVLPDVSGTHLVLALTSINGRNSAIYNFSGTQAAANDYEIDTGTLSLANVNLNDDVNLRGMVTPYGSGPVDFTAQTVIDNTSAIIVP